MFVGAGDGTGQKFAHPVCYSARNLIEALESGPEDAVSAIADTLARRLGLRTNPQAERATRIMMNSIYGKRARPTKVTMTSSHYERLTKRLEELEAFANRVKGALRLDGQPFPEPTRGMGPEGRNVRWGVWCSPPVGSDAQGNWLKSSRGVLEFSYSDALQQARDGNDAGTGWTYAVRRYA